MIPVSASVPAPDAPHDLDQQLQRELSALGVDPITVSIGDDSIEVAGLLHLSNVPLDERRRRVDSTVRVVLYDAGFDSETGVTVRLGWDYLPSTTMLPNDLQRVLTHAGSGASDEARDGEQTTRPNEVYSKASEYDISPPMVERLVRQRRQENRTRGSSQIGDS